MELSQINNRIFFLHQYSPYFLFKKFDIVKWTVSVILSDPLCKDGNVRFTTIPLEALSDHVWIRYPCFGFWFLHKSDLSMFLGEMVKINYFLNHKNEDIFHIIDQIKVLRILLWIKYSPLLQIIFNQPNYKY